MSDLPLPVNYLLKRLVPDANYVLNGRSYEDIIWMDNNIKQPSKQDLENEFLRIQGLEKAFKDKDAEVKEAEKLSKHDLLKKVIASAEFELAKTRMEAQAEKNRIIREHEELMRKEHEDVSKLRETLSQLRLEHINKKQSLASEIELYKAEILKLEKEAPKKIKAVAEKAARMRTSRDPKKVKPNQAPCGGFHNYVELRAKALPSKADIAREIEAGGKRAAAMLDKIQEVHDKFPKPKKKEDWR